MHAFKKNKKNKEKSILIYLNQVLIFFKIPHMLFIILQYYNIDNLLFHI